MKWPHQCSSHVEDKAIRKEVTSLMLKDKAIRNEVASSLFQSVTRKIRSFMFQDKANRNNLASSMFTEAGHSEVEARRNEAASSTFQFEAIRAFLHSSCVPSPAFSNLLSRISLTALWISQLDSINASMQSATGI